jgi:hypothetical protein
MKFLRLSTVSLLALSGLSSCSQSEPPAEVARAEKTPAAVEPAPTSVPAAPAAAPSPAAALPVTPAAKTESAPGEPPRSPATDPAYARGGAKRAQGAADNKLETGYDLTKAAEAQSADHDHEGHDHADHTHGEVTKPVPQDGSSLLPVAQAQKNSGRFELVDGTPQIQDLGKMRQGEAASFDFKFQSKGEGPLVVTGVKPSCGCTKAEIVLLEEDGTRKPYTKGEPIPVGQKFVLESEISTDGKPGGPFNAQISLYGNDARGVFNVRLTAEIEPILTVTPSQAVYFGRMTTADTREQVVNVTTTRGEPFALSIGQEALQQPLGVELTAKDPDAEGRSNEWTVKVTLGPNAEVGMRSYPLQMRTDLPIAKPKYPSKDGTPQTHIFMLNVQAQVTGMVSAEPSFLTFGMVRPGEPVERALRVECHDDFKLTADLPVLFEGLQGQEFPYKDAFAVTIQPVEEGKAADVRVKLNGMPADLNGSFGGVLRLQLGHPHMQELQVRFSGVCRPALPTVGGQGGQVGGQPVSQPVAQPK